MKTLRIPDEPRFVRAFALAVDPGDTLGLLMETGVLGSPDVSIVRRTREALIPAYDRASDQKDWDQTHTISVLREALAQSELSLPEWRERVWKLLFAMPDNALPKPSEQPAAGPAPCTCSETDSPKALTHEHAGWCPTGDHPNERSRES